MLFRKSFPILLVFFVFSSPYAGELKTPSEVPSMSGLPIDVTRVHDTISLDPELVGLRVMAIMLHEYTYKKVPCSNQTGRELISDFKIRVKNETRTNSTLAYEQLSVDEQNRVLARSIATEWTLTKTAAGKKERLMRTGRNPAQCL